MNNLRHACVILEILFKPIYSLHLNINRSKEEKKKMSSQIQWFCHVCCASDVCFTEKLRGKLAASCQGIASNYFTGICLNSPEV